MLTPSRFLINRDDDDILESCISILASPATQMFAYQSGNNVLLIFAYPVSRTVFSTGGKLILSTKGKLATPGDIFGCQNWCVCVGDDISIKWDAAKCHSMHKIAIPIVNNYLAPNIISVEVEKH